MEFEVLVTRYFGTPDLETVSPAMLRDGLDRLHVDFGIECDSGHRFGLWTVMYMLGDAPDIDVAFADADERATARDFMDMVDEIDAD